MLFISPQTLFSFSRYLGFCFDFMVTKQNGLIRKIRLMPNFMTSQPGQQTIVTHTLSNISRSKGNQTMKFGQLIEYIIRNIILEKSYTLYAGETCPRPFSGKLRLSISSDQQSKVLFFFLFFLYSLLLLYPKLRTIEIY